MRHCIASTLQIRRISTASPGMYRPCTSPMSGIDYRPDTMDPRPRRNQSTDHREPTAAPVLLI